MRYALTASLVAFLSAGAFYYSSTQPKALELVQIQNTWIENVAIRSNGDFLMTTIGEGKVPVATHPIFKIEGVNALSGIVGEILRIDTTTGHVEVAIKDKALAPVPGGPFPVGVNGIKIFNDYLYFTNTAHQSFNRVKIDDIGNKLGDFEVLAKLEKGSPYAPDDFAMDRHGNAYVVYWQDRVVKITRGGKQTALVEGLLAGPSSATFSNDGKILYVVTSGQNNHAVSGGQVVEVKL
ncbi:hypothetical protein ACKAV7_003099 [Fusarium commune]